MYHATNTTVPLPDTRVVRTDNGYDPVSEGYSLAKGDIAPFNPDDNPGISIVDGAAIIQMFGVL